MSLPAHSETGPLGSVESVEETITAVPEDFVRGMTSAAGTLPTVGTHLSAMAYGQNSNGTSSSWTGT